ncbi:MAG: hypothetical protein KJ621_19875 [Proteobacteria bacterium]|nr:hypothetical protein [Pseudomonadota bacterium]MBU1741989.1 hypothetical protein [Pseudomonadota bacterium]
MKRVLLPLVPAVALVGLVALPVLGAGAKVAKQGSAARILYFSGTYKAIVVGKAHVHWIYKVFGLTGIGPKTSPFFHSSCHCLGTLYWTNWKKRTYESSGTCVYTRPDGDKIIVKISAVGKGGPANGKWTIVGGTGKFVGMTGQGTFLRVNTRPAARGTFQGYHLNKGNYQLP